MHTLWRLLLHLLPPAFRERFGEEMLAHADAELQAAAGVGGWSGVRTAMRTTGELVVTAVQERWDPTWIDGAGTRPRGMGGRTMMGIWMRDLAQAARSLKRSPGFALAAIGTLAIALGSNAGIFAALDRVLLDPLPYPDTDRVVRILASAPGTDLPQSFGVSREFLIEYEENATHLEDVAAYNSFTATVRVGDRVERASLSAPTDRFFQVLRVEPVLGRLPGPGDRDQVAVISHSFWTTWFGQDPSVIGQSHFMMDGFKTIIGVMPPEFAFPNDRVNAWLPQPPLAEDAVIEPGRFGMSLVGRVAPDVTDDALSEQLTTIVRRLPEEYGGSARYAELIEQHVPVITPIQQVLLGDIRGAFLVLFGAVVVVLLIACANVANLFAVRAESRGRDLAIRRAIGAGRRRLIEAQMAEALVIAAVASLLALPLAIAVLRGFIAVAPGYVPRLAEAQLGLGTSLYLVAVGLASAVLCGLVPALRASRPAFARLRDGGRGTTGRAHWARGGLVVGQTALALVLLVGSGLLLRSFQALRAVDPGFDAEDVVTFQFAPEQAHLTDGEAWAGFHLAFMDRLRALPGVESVGIIENVPLDEGVQTGPVYERDEDAEVGPRAGLTFAGGDYFQTLGIDVLEGRPFNDDDGRIPGAVVISRSVAEAVWPGESPIGRPIRTSMVPEVHTVVGVVEDVLQYDLRDEADGHVYYPLVGPTPEAWRLSSPGYAVKTARAESIVPEIRALVREVAPEAPMYRTYTLEELVDRTMTSLAFTMRTLAIAAGLALLLGAIGLYGVLSYVVAERRQEIGVRMALGARAAQVRGMVVRQGGRVVGLGVVIGLVVAFAGTRFLGSLLFGVAAFDLPTFGAMAAAMVLVGLLASYLPARRASLVDPMESMREG